VRIARKGNNRLKVRHVALAGTLHFLDIGSLLGRELVCSGAGGGRALLRRELVAAIWNDSGSGRLNE
jgi:hypothetical protein